MKMRILGAAALLAAIMLSGCYTRLGTVRDEQGWEDEPLYEEPLYGEADSSAADQDSYVTEDEYEDARDRLYYDYYYAPSYTWWDDPWYWRPSWGWSYWYGSMWYRHPSSYFWYWPGAVAWADPGWWYPYNSGPHAWHGGTVRSSHRTFGTTRTLGGTRGDPGTSVTRGGTYAPLPSGGAVQRPSASQSSSNPSRRPAVNRGQRGEVGERSGRSATTTRRSGESVGKPAPSSRSQGRPAGVSTSRPKTGRSSRYVVPGTTGRSSTPAPAQRSAPRYDGGRSYSPPPASRAPEGRSAPAPSSGSSGRSRGETRSGGRR
jgi:hypothetical protein